MKNYLIQKFMIGDADPMDSSVRSRVGSLSGAVGIGLNLLLFVLKLAVGLLSGSVAIMADAWNNLSDASASVLTLVGFRLAGRPADVNHPFGHARFEYLSGLAVAAMILAIGLELGRSSVSKIFSPQPVLFSWVAMAILVASVALKFWLYRFNLRLSRLIGSSALKATAQDSRNDCVATAAVLVAMLAEHFSGICVDGWMGLAVAVFILYSGWNTARETASRLLGEGADPELRQRMGEYIAAQPGVLGYHDLMIHDYGPGKRFASIHVEMDRSEDPMLCHERIDAMERYFLDKENVHLVIHYDPVVTDDPELIKLRQRVEAVLKVRDSRITIHDFRVSREGGFTELTFDAAVPPELAGSAGALSTSLEQTLNTLGSETYRVNITFDLPQ